MRSHKLINNEEFRPSVLGFKGDGTTLTLQLRRKLYISARVMTQKNEGFFSQQNSSLVPGQLSGPQRELSFTYGLCFSMTD